MAAIDVIMTAFENKTGKDKAVTQSEFVYAMSSTSTTRPSSGCGGASGMRRHHPPLPLLSHPMLFLFRCGRASTTRRPLDQGRGRRDVQVSHLLLQLPPMSNKLFSRKSLDRRAPTRRWTRGLHNMDMQQLERLLELHSTKLSSQPGSVLIYFLIWDLRLLVRLGVPQLEGGHDQVSGGDVEAVSTTGASAARCTSAKCSPASSASRS